MVTNSPWKQVFESESAPKLTSVCRFSSSNKKPMNTCQNRGTSLIAESSTSKRESVAGCGIEEKSIRTSDVSKEISAIKKKVDQVRVGSLVQEKRVKIHPKKDLLMQLHKASLEDSARMLQAMNEELDFKLTKHGKVQLAELAAMVRAVNKEMETVEAVELDICRESLWDIVKEGSSLRSLLESLKLKLETILSQKPELKDMEDHTIYIRKRGFEFEACPVEVNQAGWAVEQKNKSHLLRTKSCGVTSHEAEKQTLAAEEFYKEKAGKIRIANQMTTLSEGNDVVCLSNSRSFANILFCGEELQSSREKEEEPNKYPEIEVAAAMSQVDADPKESSFPDFSIRNFVSTARNKDIKMSWPFSRGSLKLCLKHTVKNPLPPFQSLDSVQSNSTNQCLAETVLPAESSLDEKPLWLKNHPVVGSCCNGFDQKPEIRYTDSNSSPCTPSDIQDFTSRVTAHSLSEIESNSTSKVPLSEVSDKQRVYVPPVGQKKKGASMNIPNKKRRVLVKVGANMDHGTAEDITSTCTVPAVAVAQNTCPVCGIFSSSSNTTLNAHIDQCLLVEPTSDCMERSRTAKARAKPRKIRLMSDICATAPCCTLEELDIRNGRITVGDANSPSHAITLSHGKIEKDSLKYVKDIDGKIEKSFRHVMVTSEQTEKDSSRHVKVTGEKIERESLRHEVTGEESERESSRRVKDTGEEDNAVYIDASGMKIRILSKTNVALSIPKCAKEMKAKILKKGKRSKFLKKHAAKNHKLSKDYIAKDHVYSKANFKEGKKHPEEGFNPSPKFEEQSNVPDSVNCFERPVLSVNNHCKGKRGRPKCKVQATGDLFVDNDLAGFANRSAHKDIKMTHTWNKGIVSEPNCMDRNNSSYMLAAYKESQLPRRRKSMTSRPSPLVDRAFHTKGLKLDTVSNQFIRENCSMSEGSEDIPIHSSPGDGVEIHPNSMEKNHMLPYANENLSTGFHDPNELTRLPTKSMFSSGKLSIATSTYSRVENSYDHSRDEATVPLNTEIGGMFNSLEADGDLHNDYKNEFVGSVSSAKLPTGELVACFSRSSDTESHRLINDTYGSESSLLQFTGSFYGAEPSIQGDDMCETLYMTEGGIDTSGHKSETIKHGNYCPPVESIPIPGPPGSYLPSFRDPCFEYLETDPHAPGIDKFNSESPTSTMSGTTVAHPDLGASGKLPCVVAEKRTLDERTGPPAENGIKISVIAGDESDKLTSDVESPTGEILHHGKESSILKEGYQPCCSSSQAGTAWNTALNVQDSKLLRRRTLTTTVEVDSGSHLGSNLNAEVKNFEAGTGERGHSSYGMDVYENASYGTALSTFGSSLVKDFSSTVRKSSCPSGCDSAVLSPPPVLRLMGKDLMVLNNDELSTAKPQSVPNDSSGTQAPFSSRMPPGSLHPAHDSRPSSSSHVLDPHTMPMQHPKLSLLNCCNNPINVVTPYKLDAPPANIGDTPYPVKQVIVHDASDTKTSCKTSHCSR